MLSILCQVCLKGKIKKIKIINLMQDAVIIIHPPFMEKSYVKTIKYFGQWFMRKWQRLVNSPSSMWEDVSKLTSILSCTIWPGNWLSPDTSTSPEPSFAFTANKSQEFSSNSWVVQRDGSHATACTDSCNLGKIKSFSLHF